MPLYIEQALQEEFKFVKLTTIRGITIRENIAYKARQYKSLQEREQLLELKEYIDICLAKLSSLEDKILIFCPTIAKLKKLGEFLDYPIYYSRLEGREDILKYYLTSADSNSRVLLSTSSLEEGIDYLTIHFVIYIDFIYSFIGFLQGNSRGGRDKQESISMFFY